MANKPIITIPIDDKQFNDFVERFNKFEQKLDALPESWKKVGAATLETNEAFSAGIGALIEHMVEASGHAKSLAEHLKEANDAQGQFTSSTREGESGLKKMVKEAKELGDNIFGIGKFLLKVGAIGIGSAVGGLFGIGKLGESAVANQRSARMLGLTTGQYRAYDTDLGRDVGDSTLNNVVNAQHDITGRYWLQRATGLNANQVGTMDAGSLAAHVAMAENTFIKNHPNWNMQTIQAAGFTQLGESQSDLLLHGNAPLSEQKRALRQYQTDSGSLNYGGGNVDALYDFVNRLRMAGQHIETDFSDKLSELNRNGALSGFITSLEKDAEILFNGIFTDKNLSSLQSGLTSVATYLGSPEFKKAVGDFADDMVSLAGWVAKALGIVSPNQSAPATDADEKDWENQQKFGTQGIYNYTQSPVKGGIFSDNDASAPWDKRIYGGPGYGFINPKGPNYKDNMDALSQAEKAANLPSGLLAATIGVESSGIANNVSPKNARGLMQLEPGVIQDYGVKDVFNPEQNIAGGAMYYRDLLKMYKGDLRKALAAYNWGQGNLNKDINGYTDATGHHAGHGDDWFAYAPKETQNQVSKILAAMAKANNKPMKVEISNKAGANVAISTNAAAA